ncbi:insulinase family protein [Luteolibacter pohnpeiensis]|uniref:Insulinase family protein n=1 Tax=Luteolibacter pohnpeiensis TaxID=454153 RepID=A0A934S250_9BACT|nr:M16 family metallopeptidase [Luteolibacter pohnpeiensis]MBK1881006.1 insulinase family protein [Luteolibacter pohnpeiensis]
MQKATPLFLVLVLAATAAFLSFSPNTNSPGNQESLNTKTTTSKEESQLTANQSGKADKSSAYPKPWPQEKSDIPADPKAVFGKLDNGFRYIIYPNSEPPSRVSLRLHIASGSLMEADDQQGLAHFMEHMVFNGSKHYAAEDLIPKMQRLGIAFGAHANAYTSFDETVYMLDLPELSKDTLDLGFNVLRDFGDGALLQEKEIDNERGVILSEKMSRDSIGYRLMQKQYDLMLPDSLISKRFPIGSSDVIKNAKRERFTDYYNRYYVPDRMTFVVVGDIDPAEMEKRIKDSFSSMTNPDNAGADPDLGPIHSPEGLKASVFTDDELTATEISLTSIRPYEAKADTKENRIEELPLALANAIVSRRFQRITQQENSPIVSGSASRGVIFNYAELGSIDVTAANDDWQAAVPVMEQEFRRAKEYGFTEAELAEVKANILNAYEQAVKREPTRKSDALASALAGSVNDASVFSTPQTNLDIVREGLKNVSLESVHQAFTDFWNTSGYHLVLTTKTAPEGTDKQLAAAFEESRGKPVEAPETRKTVEFGYTDFGKPGKIVSRNEIEDLGITQLVLSNQIRVNLKKTDFETNRIRLLARIGTGQLSQPADTPMFDAFATAVFEGGGLGKHSNDELQEILAGKNVSSGLSIGEDAFNLAGSTTPKDLQLELRLMAATLTDPGYRKEGLWQFQKAVPMIFQQLKHTPSGPQQEMNAWMYGNDFRYTVPSAEKLNTYTIDQVKDWLNPQLTKGYMELTIVGDFDMDTLLPELLATFGALPTRDATPPALDDRRKIEFANAPARKLFTYESKVPQGIATTIWKTDGIRGNQPEFRRLNILASIYGDRLREEIREKLGASYSPSAGASGSDAMDDVGYVIGQSIAKPEDVDRLLDTMLQLADKLSTEGATQDELDRALKPVIGQLKKSLRDNGYWLGTVMSQCQLQPERLDLARNRDEDYNSIKLADINALAKKYLGSGNALLVGIKPQE